MGRIRALRALAGARAAGRPAITNSTIATWNDAWPALRAHAQASGVRLLERETCEMSDRDGRRIRLIATTRWADFDLYGVAQRERAMRSAGYFMRLMQATRDGRPFDAAAMRAEALDCRDWLAQS